MECALAVVEGDETAKGLVREAGELAAATGADMVLVHVTTEEEYAERREDLAAIPDRAGHYGIGEELEGARQYAADIGAEVLEGIDVDYDVVGRLGGKANEVLAVATDQNCDHIFMSGPKRSPAGKAVFGDATQEVILEFSGPVTVVTA